ncbi:hypothetical protein GWI33_004288, partial [Rhynchophorus ferrugineus]
MLHTDQHKEGDITDTELEPEQYCQEYHAFKVPKESYPTCSDVLCNKFESLDDMHFSNEQKHACRGNESD